MITNNKIRTYEGATAIVTGAASGIGKALVKELAKLGSEVILADIQIEEAEKIALEIRDSGGKAIAVKTDVTDSSSLEHLVNETTRRTGRIDYMFNNAGITITGKVEFYSLKDWNKILEINLRGVINGIQAVYPVMINQGFGHIVNTGSVAGLYPNAISVGYATTKHAIVGLSNSLRIEAAQKGIHVSVLCPGVISTPILGGGKFGIRVSGVTPECEELHKLFWEGFTPMLPETFAKKALRSIAKNKAIIIEPAWWKIIWKLYRFSPYLADKISENAYKSLQKQITAKANGSA